jgi:hypothetical protein
MFQTAMVKALMENDLLNVILASLIM